jgi:hypothetical protein
MLGPPSRQVGELVGRTHLPHLLRASHAGTGALPGCKPERLLPGRDAAGTAICWDCASISRDFFCDRCGFEGLLLGGRLCEHCTLSDRLTVLLDDGTGRIHPRLVALHQLLVSLDRPKSRLIWLCNPQGPALLRDFATGTVPFTHDAIQALPNWRTAAYLRDLLMDSGVLPHLDRRLLLSSGGSPSESPPPPIPNTPSCCSSTSPPGISPASSAPRRLRARWAPAQRRNAASRPSRPAPS